MESKKLTSSSGSFDYVKDVSIAEASFDRVLPRQLSSGTLRGTQAVGGDKILIDSSNERIGVGKIDGTELYALNLASTGLTITDGTVTYINLTKDGLVLNDGTTDRVLVGKDEGGF